MSFKVGDVVGFNTGTSHRRNFPNAKGVVTSIESVFTEVDFSKSIAAAPMSGGYYPSSLRRIVTKLKRPTTATQAYKGNGNHMWEEVVQDGGVHTERLRVPGGWLYKTEQKDTLMQTFVPMPEVVKHAL